VSELYRRESCSVVVDKSVTVVSGTVDVPASSQHQHEGRCRTCTKQQRDSISTGVSLDARTDSDDDTSAAEAARPIRKLRRKKKKKAVPMDEYSASSPTPTCNSRSPVMSRRRHPAAETTTTATSTTPTASTSLYGQRHASTGFLADVHGSLPLLSRPSPPCPAAARLSGSRRADQVGQLATVPDGRRRRRRHSVIVVERCCPTTGHWLNSDVVMDCCHGSTSSTSAAARSSRCSQVSASVAVLIAVFVCSPP